MLNGRIQHSTFNIEHSFSSFCRGFIDELASKLQRSMRMVSSVTERHVYLDIDGHAMTTVIEENRLG